MTVIALEEQDEFDVSIDDLEELQRGFLSMESMLTEISRKSTQFRNDGICRTDAVALEMLDPEMIHPNYPVSSFTVTPSRTNLDVATESLWDKTQRVFEAIWNMILDFFEKIGEAIQGFRSKLFNKDPKAEAKKNNSSLDKTKGSFEKEEKRVIDALQKELNSERSKNSQLEKQLQDIQAYQTPALRDASDLAKSSYSTLARLVVTEPKRIKRICEQFSDFPAMTRILKSMTEMLKDSLNKAVSAGDYDLAYAKHIQEYSVVADPMIERYARSLVTLNEILPTPAQSLKYTDDNPGSVLQLATAVRDRLRRSATEPSGKTLEDDFGHDLSVMIRNRENSLEFISEAFKAAKELDSLTEEMKANSAILKRMRSRARSVEIEGKHAVEIRNAIIGNVNQLRNLTMALVHMRISLNYIVQATERHIVATARLYALGTNELRKLR